MSCLAPTRIPHPHHKREASVYLTVPCGRCKGCLLDRGRDWQVRCMNELQFHDSSYFVTLTYRDDALCINRELPSLCPPDMTKFFKRLRRKGQNVRYFYAGEYGDTTNRPHYHAIVFGLKLDDLKAYTVRGGNPLFTSAFLDSCWSHGSCVVGSVTPESIGYTVGYCLKKLYGPDATTYYKLQGLFPPFVRMSNRPGIGERWISKYYKQVIGQDFVRLGDFKAKVPRYYEKVLARADAFLEEDFSRAEARRAKRIQSFLHERFKYTKVDMDRRLFARGLLLQARLDQKPPSVF